MNTGVTELFFSIVIPVYNRGERILQTLESVAAQNYKNLELIVINDGSTDNSEDVILAFTGFPVTYSKIINSERGKARNTGVQLAKGDYVTFLDSDDILYPYYLKNANESLVSFNYPEFFHLGYEFKNDSGKTFTYAKGKNLEDINLLVEGNPLSCLGIFIQREVSLKFPFVEDRNLSGSEDWELWIRLAANFGMKSDPRVSACLMVHDDRSVLQSNEMQLLTRKNLALQYAFLDPRVMKIFGPHRKKMESYCDTYIALHLVISGRIVRGWKYVFQAMRNYPATLLSRRFLAIVKHSVVSVFNARGNPANAS